MKCVLITGATGGLGHNAVDFLLERGITVRATGRNTQIGLTLSKKGAEFIPADLATLSQQAAYRLIAGVDAIWHCAAMSAPWGSSQEFVGCNVTATETLLTAATTVGVPRFIHISSPAIYFQFSHHLNVPETFRAVRYANEYARTKALSEQRIQEICAHQTATTSVILRPRAIFGPYDQVLIPRLARVMKKRAGRLPLPRGGDTLLDVTFAENVVHAMWLASLKSDIVSGSTYNITNDEPTTVGEVLKALFVRELGQSLRIPKIPYPLMAMAAKLMEATAFVTREEPMLTAYSLGVLAYDMTLDITKAKADLGYQPIVNLQEGITRTACWIKENGNPTYI